MSNISDVGIRKECTGCGTCSAICPTGAIKYELNNEGFYEATVVKELCVNCGKCTKVCIKFLGDDTLGNIMISGEMLSAQSTNTEAIESCTSGGIAYEISKYGIENGYKIVGVIYDYNNNLAKTVIRETIEDLEDLKGSKYLQSKADEGYKELIERAKRNSKEKYIIFGTPCQILGITKAFKNEGLKNEIITVDLFCHGVPSYLIWNLYLKWLKDKKGIDKINKINFRSKHYGWHNFTMGIESDGKDYYKPSEYDVFYKTFFDNILLNKSCHKCIVRKEISAADIRLGDFWGKRYQDRQDGISAVLINTTNGKELINKLVEKNKVKIIDKVEVNECLKSQATEDYIVTKFYDYYNEVKNKKELNEIIKFYRKDFPMKKRIKIKMKESTAYLPPFLRSNLRVIVNKLK